jgi:AraC-like DNA-binding protein
MWTADRILQGESFSLLAGGFHRCDPSWNKPADGIDQCYKLYLPVRGKGLLTLDGQQVSLRPGRAYLIPGYRLVRQECPRRLDVYWIHFVPELPYLAFLLSHVARVHACDRRWLEYWRATCEKMPPLFECGSRDLFYRVQAMLMDLVCDVLQSYNLDHLAAADPVFEQLQPAVLFMDRHLAENPTLAEIARAVHLAPNYFHRKFTRTFHVTPFGYMLSRRLNVSRQLLLSTNLSLARIAERCGFSSAFHLSKLFKKHCGLSPKLFRARALP